MRLWQNGGLTCVEAICHPHSANQNDSAPLAGSVGLDMWAETPTAESNPDRLYRWVVRGQKLFCDSRSCGEAI